MKSWLVIAAALAVAFSAGNADGKKGQKGPKNNGAPGITVTGGADLVADNISFKVNCNKTPCKINNFRLTVKNQGDMDMPNSRVEFWLGAEDTLQEGSPVVGHTLIHTQSLGKVKAGKSKRRTVGGGHFKNLVPPAVEGVEAPIQYIIAVVNPGAVGEVPSLVDNNTLTVPFPIP